ncbi:MAG: fibronectin type III domain-containing protein [Candidatus Levybacteria bacterium]|nr:fibronectin type III domain-containing protein [Candidatus Levybacteria bacterium]
MQGSLLYKRIPTLLGLILIGFGIFIFNYAVNHGVFFLTKASPTYSPEEIRITNLTDSSFTVSYITKDSVLGSLGYGKTSSGGKVALDDRDQQSGIPQPYSIHHITVKNLEPNTQYYFSITSSDKTFLDKGKPFAIKTLMHLSESPNSQQPIVGTVNYPDGSSDNNTIVFLVSDDTQTFSVLTKKDGTFIMPLNALRKKDFLSYSKFGTQSIIKLLAVSPQGKATVSVLPSQINPVPPVTITNSYDFTSEAEQHTAPIASSSADTSSSFPSFSATEVSTSGNPTILSPEKEEPLHDNQPTFEGTALPNSEIQIEIHSDEQITTTIKSGTGGTWSYRPDTKLSPGEHTITIKTKNKDGILQTITRSFTVFAEGSQFVEPSVIPSPTITPTPKVQTPTPSPTLAPSSSPSPTHSPTPTSPVPTALLTQSVPPPEENPGSPMLLFSGIISVIILSTGFFLLHLGKKSL